MLGCWPEAAPVRPSKLGSNSLVDYSPQSHLRFARRALRILGCDVVSAASNSVRERGASRVNGVLCGFWAAML